MAIPVATQAVFTHDDTKTEVWAVASATAARSLVKQAGSGRYGVTLTRAPGGSAVDELEIGPFKITRPKAVGVGNDEATAVGTFAAGVATDGTWEFEGIVSTGSTPVPTTTEQGVVVYAEADGDLTLVSTDNFRVGVVNYPATYTKSAGTLPIQIGA